MKKIIVYDWVIYKIVSPSGKLYIGKTTDFNCRKSGYKTKKNLTQPKLKASFGKYGFELHLFSIIDEFQGDNNLSNEKEKFWIDYYKTNYCKYPKGIGLNLTDGGEGIKGNKFLGTDEERKIRYGKHNLGHTRNRGRKQSQAVIIAKNKRLTGRPNTKKYKPILQFDLKGNFIKEYVSIQETNKETRVDKSSIHDILNGKTKNPRYFIFKYKNAV